MNECETCGAPEHVSPDGPLRLICANGHVRIPDEAEAELIREWCGEVLLAWIETTREFLIASLSQSDAA